MSNKSKGAAKVHHVTAPGCVKIMCAGNKRHMRIMTAAYGEYEALRKGGYKGSWWNKRAGDAANAE